MEPIVFNLEKIAKQTKIDFMLEQNQLEFQYNTIIC